MSMMILVFAVTSRHENILECGASVDDLLTVRADRDRGESDSSLVTSRRRRACVARRLN